MRARSLHFKLFWTCLIGATIVLAVLVTAIGYIAYNNSLKDSAALVNSIVKTNARDVEVKFATGWTVADTLANTVTAMQQQRLPRGDTDAVTRQLLVSNSGLLGIGHYWEPNAYDGRDRDYVGSPNHDTTGRYITYWNRSNGGVHSEVLTSYEVESTETQYYYRPLRTRQPWASEPYRYTTADGQSQLIMSMMIPLIVGGEAVGVAGADIPLQTINDQLKEVNVYGGYGALISTEGLYASHPDQALLGKAADQLPASAKAAVKSGKAYSFERDGWNYVLEPVKIGNAPTSWSLLVAYPIAQALVAINAFVRTAISTGVFGLMLLAIALWVLLRWQIQPLTVLTNSIHSWKGELNLRFADRGEDETGKLASAFNQFIGHLGDLVNSIRASSTSVLDISDHLGQATREASERASTQNTATEEMANGVTALAHSVTEVAQQAERMEHLARSTEKLTLDISNDVSETLDGITHIDQTMSQVAETVGGLEQRSMQIAGIVAVIRSIADQTNLLALNAAIEAARAGDQGRGFAVVADEVRQLSERTGRSTTEIAEMIEAIGLDVRNTVVNVELVGNAVRQGVDQLTASVKGVEEISSHAQEILAGITEVARQTQGQAATGEQLSVAIQGVSRISDQSLKAMAGLLEQSVELRAQATGLKTQLGAFNN